VTPATAQNLSDLHLLHQRARALRDRMASGPKTLAARQLALGNRQTELDGAKKTLQDSKLQLKKHEHSIQGVDTKIDDLKVKLNLVKKNDEYKALQNQIAHENTAKSKIEEEMLVALEAIEVKTAELVKLEVEVKRFDAEVTALKQQIDDEAVSHKSQLQELETAIIEAETAIPEEYRAQYRRIVHVSHEADAQRPHQRRGTLLLLELRTAPLHDRARGRQHSAHGIELTRRRSRRSRSRRRTQSVDRQRLGTRAPCRRGSLPVAVRG
jgi:predicted  nucleic acid-binding Zn-ribbon protein